jgi:hypothetical protein
MRLSGCFRAVLGILIAVALIGSGLYAIARFYQDKYGSTPSKPLFEEEQGQAFKPLQTRGPKPIAPPKSATAKPADATPKATPKPQGDLVIVTWPEGLLVRSSADVNGEEVGGIEFKREVYLLESSGDKAWDKIKVANGDLEGWVKGGNLEKKAE